MHIQAALSHEAEGSLPSEYEFWVGISASLDVLEKGNIS